MNEAAIRRLLVITTILGLLGGLLISRGWILTSQPQTAAGIWAATTVPVLIALAVSIIRDFVIGRIGVDAIALVSMSAALMLGEALAAAVVALMYSGGVLLEDFARGRAQRDLRALEDRSPRLAHRLRNDGLETISVDDVQIGDELLVNAGELIPVDGSLLNAEAKLDESALTGEPLPVSRARAALAQWYHKCRRSLHDERHSARAQ